MKLLELDAHFVKLDNPVRDEGSRTVNQIDQTDALVFVCPICRGANRRNPHNIVCWRDRVAATVCPGRPRYYFDGNSPTNLTLRANEGADPVIVTSQCGAAFTVRAGQVFGTP